jgi:CHAT domain
MTDFITVKLELMRPGPPHNQLLSPLTPYMALCGDGSPITFHIDIEHHQLLSRLERLRYVSGSGPGVGSVPDRVRQAAVIEVGGDVERILGEIRTLLAEISRARASYPARDVGERAVHLRLVLGGSELSLIPFEMAFAPQAFPGEGLNLTLQLAMPVVPTRETRSSRQSPVAWDRELRPRVLFISAAPEGLRVPADAHILALRAAVEPWVAWPRGGAPAGTAEMDTKRLEHVRERLRLIVDASIEEIHDVCATERFTHVHILAHGDTFEMAGEQRFGLALCRRGDRARKEVVSGPRLAEALQANSSNRGWRSSPLVVTLSTCDSGNARSVLVPGGSIAHDLHVAGIPWVFASQFPLTVVGSVRLTEALYPLLLRGDDPRDILHDVRQQLHMSAERDHDWAALVAYVSVPDDLGDQVYRFFEDQTRRAIDVSLARADDLTANKAGETVARREAIDRQLRLAVEALDRWRARLREGSAQKERTRRAECFGMHGSVYKRMALLRESNGEKDESKALLRQALDYYRKAMEEWAVAEERHHWVATQALSLGAVLATAPDERNFRLARELANRDLENPSPVQRAWAHGTIAELEMLGPYHTGSTPEKLQETVVAHCREIVNLAGAQSFQVASTRRQFQRYLDAWTRPDWQPIARAAVEALRG